jgi:NAD-dependent SIR2 family protein deacetylase
MSSRRSSSSSSSEGSSTWDPVQGLGILRRCYTQNIDGLERLAGLDDEKLVEAHGTFATSRCSNPKCKKM